ncbi:MAG TPA: YkgJ family cysteine cluster protein [Dehalococcoidia bacterium]|nr:YkgJ family cysteine cluster protein [Dehalococcoidia bacterium]
MRIILHAAESQRSFDTGLGRFTDEEAIPCFRCGVCCRRWQPLIGRDEAERLASFLGLPLQAFLAGYARPYPLAEERYQLLEREGGCTFLREEDGRAGCAVHEARPQACRDWDASLSRRECLDGLRKLGDGRDPVAVLPLFDGPEAPAFVRHLRRLRRLPPTE